MVIKSWRRIGGGEVVFSLWIMVVVLNLNLLCLLDSMQRPWFCTWQWVCKFICLWGNFIYVSCSFSWILYLRMTLHYLTCKSTADLLIYLYPSMVISTVFVTDLSAHVTLGAIINVCCLLIKWKTHVYRWLVCNLLGICPGLVIKSATRDLWVRNTSWVWSLRRQKPCISVEKGRGEGNYPLSLNCAPMALMDFSVIKKIFLE